MLAEVVLITRLLALQTGARVIEAQVDPNVTAVEIVLDGKPAATMRGAPWRARIDFGPELAPHELTAIARNEYGHEVGRDTQLINLARPHAELDVMFSRKGGKLLANIRWQHIGAARPVAMKVKLDGKTILRRVATVLTLPGGDSSRLRLLDVQVAFNDGSIARREVVFGGIYTEKMPAELTATVVRQRADGRADLARCFTSDGAFVSAEAVEAGEAVVLFVRSIHPAAARQALLAPASREERIPESALILPGASLRFVWPVAVRSGDATLFLTSPEYDGIRGVRWLLTRFSGPPDPPERMIDAAAVAGSEALRYGRRRAVVVVLGSEDDRSAYSPELVKHYLARIGVPLHVWSLRGAADPVWGEVEDVSTSATLRDAVGRLRRELDQQRVAWLPLDPYRALKVETVEDCAWTVGRAEARPTSAAQADAAALPAAR